MLWRQGDLFIAHTPSIPEGAKCRPDGVLLEGELMGHRHRLENLNSASVYEHNGQLFLSVLAQQVRLIHEEHGAITLPAGNYRVWRQREYDPRRYGRLVAD